MQRFDSTFSGGEGTENNLYQIKTVADLQQLATDVNNGTSYSEKYFKLMASIDLGSVNFTPIGNYDSSPFATIPLTKSAT